MAQINAGGSSGIECPESGGLDWKTDQDGPAPRHPFDREERPALFGEAIIRFLEKEPRGPHNDVGANPCEANEGLSQKDFRNTIGRCRKESKESKVFLRMIAAAEPSLAGEARDLYREAKELHLIFCNISRKTTP